MSPLDYDDPDDDDRRPANVPLPSGIKIAGIIWISFGVLGLIAAMFTFAASNGVGCCGVLTSLVFAIVGLQTFHGEAKRLLGNAIGSIIFGLLYGAASIAIISLNQKIEVIAVGALIALFSLSLLVAGFLALVNRADYERWLRAQGLASWPRALTDEQCDYDDEYQP